MLRLTLIPLVMAGMGMAPLGPPGIAIEPGALVTYQTGAGESAFAYTVKAPAFIGGMVAGTATETAQGLVVKTHGLIVSPVKTAEVDTAPGKGRVKVNLVTVVKVDSSTTTADMKLMPPRGLSSLTLHGIATAYQWPVTEEGENRIDKRFDVLLKEFVEALKNAEAAPDAMDAVIAKMKAFEVGISSGYAMRAETTVTQDAESTHLVWESMEGILRDGRIAAWGGHRLDYTLNLNGSIAYVVDLSRPLLGPGLVTEATMRPAPKLGELLSAARTFPFPTRMAEKKGTPPSKASLVSMATNSRLWIDKGKLTVDPTVKLKSVPLLPAYVASLASK